MRLLQLATSPDEVLDLHPNVSVVVGLSESGRGLLTDAVTRLARAEAVEAPGLLEAHGVLFDLDPILMELIEPAPPDVDPIVQAVHLPSQPVSLDVRELRAREDAFAVLLELIRAQTDKQSAARSTLAAATTALEAAHAARAEAVEAHEQRAANIDEAATRVEALVDERRHVRNEHGEVQRALEAARALQGTVEERTSAVREASEAATALRSSIEAELEALEAAEATPEPVEIPAPAEEPRPVEPPTAEAVIADADAERIAELEQLLALLAPGERALVEEALAQVAGNDGAALVPSTEAIRVATELDWIDDQLGDSGAGDHDDGGALSLAEAQARLDDARQALLEAEQAVRTPELDRDDVLRLEDVHGELIEAIEKADGRFGRTRAQNRVAELRGAEQEVLDRLGFTSYSAYMMGYSLTDTDPAKEAALDRAREELAAAEDTWAMLQDASEDELERAAALDRRRELLKEAERLVGGELTGPPQAALRALRVPAVVGDEAASVLRASLDSVGVDVGDEELDRDDLVVIAEAWLAEADGVEARRDGLREELAVLRGERPVPSPEPVTREPAVPAEASAPAEPVVSELSEEARKSDLARDLANAREMEQSAAATARAADDEVASVVDEIASLEAKLAELEGELARADAAVADAERAMEELSADLDLSALDRQLETAKAVHSEAETAMQLIDASIATLDAEGRAEAQEIERLQDIVADQGTGSATPAEELEWYLLARLAALRSISVAGSVPLLLDDALRGLGVEEVCHLLTRLERMADVVQVIVLSDDPVVASWAATTGAARAAVVSPTAV